MSTEIISSTHTHTIVKQTCIKCSKEYDICYELLTNGNWIHYMCSSCTVDYYSKKITEIKEKNTQYLSSSHFDQNECVICLESFSSSNKELVKIHCDHIFHIQCLAKWFCTKNTKQCPICKK